MTKICHVTSAHNINDVRIFKKECVSLAKNDGYNVYLVGPGESKICDGVNIVGVGEKPNSRFARMLKFAPKVIDEAVKVDADIYHLHDPELLRFALNFKKLGKKVIFDSHENILDSIDDKTYMPVLMRKVFKTYYRVLQRRVLSKIDGIVAVTPQMVDSYQLLNNHVVLITNFPIIEGNSIIENKNTSIVKGRFIFAGGITPQWSHKEIITAIEDIDGVEYYLFGPADEVYLEELKLLRGWSKVYYGGKVPFEVVQEELAKAQFVFALVKPSKNSFFNQGTLGNTKLFEAFEKGKPVIASDFELWKDIVEKNNCGVCVNPNSVSQIKFAVQSILKSTESEYDIMSTSGKRIVNETYNWSVCETKLFDLYKIIINKEN